MGRPKGIPMSQEQKELRRNKFKGKNNPFYGKRHSEETKVLMSKNHADFNGDKNPFKKSLENKENLDAHKSRCLVIWSQRDKTYRTNFGNKIKTGYMDISGTFWGRLKSNAKQKGRTLDFNIEYIWELFIQQNRKCALSGITLNFSNDLNNCTASLDRIDNNKSYVKGNVQWVHKTINLMKRTLDQSEFLSYCKIITEHQNESKNLVG